jgi:hypothetical protein
MQAGRLVSSSVFAAIPFPDLVATGTGRPPLCPSRSARGFLLMCNITRNVTDRAGRHLRSRSLATQSGDGVG